MKFKLEIDCDNAAFGESTSELAAELATICSDVYRRIGSREMSPAQGAGMTFPLYDSNGNRVGFAKFERGE